MKMIEDLCSEKNVFLSLKPEITASTIIALEKECFAFDIEKAKEKELVR